VERRRSLCRLPKDVILCDVAMQRKLSERPISQGVMPPEQYPAFHSFRWQQFGGLADPQKTKKL
jgi:hypothetical protein